MAPIRAYHRRESDKMRDRVPARDRSGSRSRPGHACPSSSRAHQGVVSSSHVNRARTRANVATNESEFEFESEFELKPETESETEWKSETEFETELKSVTDRNLLLVIDSHADPRKAFPLHLSHGGRAAANASFSDAFAALATPAASTTTRTSSTLETANP